MDDYDYHAKYSRPYEEGEKIPRMAKQMIDARHVAGKSGVSLNVAASDRPAAVGADIGGFHYPVAWFEERASLAGLLTTGPGDGFVGATGGFRVQSPTRLAPFVGIGGFAGSDSYEVDAESDFIDNDNDLFVDEPGEVRDESRLLAAVYPEVGAHFWLTSQLRLTGSASYYMTTRGRDEDFWFIGVGLGWMPVY